jgi:malonyl-CoA decarboxylase
VARFHLGNGARLQRLNWLGDTSEKAMRQSHGLMVNYLYSLTDVERNHEAYANRGLVAASRAVRALLDSANTRRGRRAEAVESRN